MTLSSGLPSLGTTTPDATTPGGSAPAPAKPVRAGLELLAWTVVGTAAIAFLRMHVLAAGRGQFSPIFMRMLEADRPLLFLSAAVLGGALVIHRWCAPVTRALAWCGRHPRGITAVLLVAFAAGARLVYHAYTLSVDEYADAFQAALLAHGRLTAHFPPAWVDRLIPIGFQEEFFLVSHVTGRVAASYWPGFALLQAPFARAGVAWLCNPVVTAGAVLAIASTVRRLAPDQPEAIGWAMLLAVASPTFVLMGISYYSMTAMLLGNLLFTWGFMSGRPVHLFWSGMVGALTLCMHNPLPHLLFALPWIAWLVWTRGVRREVVALVLGYLPITVVLGLGWVVLRHHLRPDEAQAAAAGAAGVLGTARRLASYITLPDRWVLDVRMAGLVKLWLWSVPGLLLLAALGAWRRRANPFVVLLGASALLTFLGFFLTHMEQGHGWGYRYFHTAWAVLPVLGALCVTAHDREPARGGERAAVAALAGLSLLVLLPAQLAFAHCWIRDHLAEAPAIAAPRQPGERRLTFVVRGGSFYSNDLVQSDPLLRGDLWMISEGPEEDDAFMWMWFHGAVPLARNRTGELWRLPAGAQFPRLDDE